MYSHECVLPRVHAHTNPARTLCRAPRSRGARALSTLTRSARGDASISAPVVLLTAPVVLFAYGACRFVCFTVRYRELKAEFKDVGLMTGDASLSPNASCLVMTERATPCTSARAGRPIHSSVRGSAVRLAAARVCTVLHTRPARSL